MNAVVATVYGYGHRLIRQWIEYELQGTFSAAQDATDADNSGQRGGR
jgi:hypothetical protein